MDAEGWTKTQGICQPLYFIYRINYFSDVSFCRKVASIIGSPFLWLGSESRVGKKSLRFSSFASRWLPFLQCVSLLGGSWELIEIPLSYVHHLKFKIKRWNEWQPRKQTTTSDGTPVIIGLCLTLSLDSCHSNSNFLFWISSNVHPNSILIIYDSMVK